MLERDLAKNHKQIRMLNGGSKRVDHILLMVQPAKVNWGVGYRRAKDIGEVHQKGLSHFVRRSASKSKGKEVRQDVQQEVRHKVLQRGAVSNKPKAVHQCNNIKVRQVALKDGCACSTQKKTDMCIRNCVRRNKKKHKVCC